MAEMSFRERCVFCLPEWGGTASDVPVRRRCSGICYAVMIVACVAGIPIAFSCIYMLGFYVDCTEGDLLCESANMTRPGHVNCFHSRMVRGLPPALFLIAWSFFMIWLGYRDGRRQQLKETGDYVRSVPLEELPVDATR